MKKPKSPCVELCQFTGPNNWCLGCGRTREECIRWKSMKPYKKKKLENELKRRLAKITAAE